MKPRVAFLLLLPAIVCFGLAFVGPIGYVGRLSLFSTDFVSESWVGLRNYWEAVTDPPFIRSFVNAGVYVVLIAGTVTLAGYWLAGVLVDLDRRLRSSLLFAFYAPTLASGLIAAMMWKWMLARAGLVNWLIGLVGIPPVGWFGVGWAARLAVSLTIVFAGLGGYVLIYTANMLSVPREVREQAAIDGAGPRQIRRYIVRPLMIPVVMLVSLLAVMSAAQVWETVLWLTSGGPGGRTSSPVFDTYLTAFVYGKHGLGAAKAVIVMAAIAALSVTKRRVEKWIAG